jgi:hypothetical protein
MRATLLLLLAALVAPAAARPAALVSAQTTTPPSFGIITCVVSDCGGVNATSPSIPQGEDAPCSVVPLAAADIGTTCFEVSTACIAPIRVARGVSKSIRRR